MPKRRRQVPSLSELAQAEVLRSDPTLLRFDAKIAKIQAELERKKSDFYEEKDTNKTELHLIGIKAVEEELAKELAKRATVRKEFGLPPLQLFDPSSRDSSKRKRKPPRSIPN